MVEEIIKEIKVAEEKADEMIKTARQTAKDIALQSDIDSDNLKKSTSLECKQNQKNAIQEAEAIAMQKREQILKQGEKDADELIDNKNAAVEEEADKIIKQLLEKYKA